MIALLTVVDAVKKIHLILEKRDAGLQDLLLMFLYVEALGMAGIYSDSKQIPIALPIFIAITALARMAILQKEQDPIISFTKRARSCFSRSPRHGQCPALGAPISKASSNSAMAGIVTL